MPDLLTQSILCPILIGRTAQVGVLSRLLDQARAGQGQIALISGEAGIGKSRLVAETKARAAAQGMAIRQGNCFEPDHTLPYAPFLDLLRSIRSATSSLANLIALLSGQQSQADEDPEQAKRRLFTALADFLLTLTNRVARSTGAEEAPQTSQVIILEDLHWCDESSLEFLAFFARCLQDQPLLLVLTYRSTEVTSTLQQLLAQLDRWRLATELSLTRLNTEGTEAMIRAIFVQQQAVQPAFVARLYNLTEGNPFFLEETLKSLVAAGEIYFDDGRWTRKAMDQLHIPRTVQVAVAQRTAQLSVAARRLLTVAAVAGRRFDFTLLQAITGHNEADLIDLIKELLRAQLVVEESAETFAFRHALTQQAIYSDLLLRERRPLHRTVAEALERLYADAPETHSADLAYHYAQAEAWAQALTYAQSAGDHARALHAPHAALEHFTRALTAAQALGNNRSAHPALGRLYRQRGQLYELLGDFEQAHTDYQAALAAAHATDELEALWQAQIDLGFLWAQRDYSQAGDFFSQALTTARQMADPQRLAHTLKRLGNWHMNVEHPAESVPMLTEALQIFETLGDQRGIAETLDVLGIANFAAANAIDGTRHYARALALFRQLADPGGELTVLGVYAPRHAVYINNVATWPADSVADRLRDGAAALTLARKLGAKPAEVLALIWPGNTLGVTGDYAAALQQVQKGLALAREIDHLHFITTGHMVLGGIYWDMLLWPQAQTHLQAALQGALTSKLLTWFWGIVGYLVSSWVQQGDLKEAEALLNEYWRDNLSMRSHGQRQLWCSRAEWLLAKREPTAALTILEQLIAADPHTATLGEQAIPRLARLRGEALTQLGRYAEAEATLIAAQPFAQDAPPLRWRLHLALGNCYRRQNRRDDADRAYGAARTILAYIAAKITEPELRQRFAAASGALFPAATEKQAAKQRTAGLTAKEREVVALIAQGKSNKEIAETLVVSHRTVETHVSNILAKLYLSSRAQIVVWAQEQHQLTQ